MPGKAARSITKTRYVSQYFMACVLDRAGRKGLKLSTVWRRIAMSGAVGWLISKSTLSLIACDRIQGLRASFSVSDYHLNRLSTTEAVRHRTGRASVLASHT